MAKKKYRVYIDKILHYNAETIEAEDEDEAEEIYAKMIDDGEIDIEEEELSKIYVEDYKEINI
jgi:hypothetical protein